MAKKKSIPKCIDLWGVLHEGMHLEIWNDENSQFLVKFFQDFFLLRDQAFKNNAVRMEVDSDKTTFTFTLEELAETFFWCYKSKDFAQYLSNHTIKSPQAEMGVRRIAALDEFFRYIYAFFIAEDVYVKLKQPYSVERFYTKDYQAYRAYDDNWVWKPMRLSAGYETVTSIKRNISRVALISDSFSTERMEEIVPKEHWILRKRVNESCYRNEYLDFDTGKHDRGYGHFLTMKTFGTLHIGPSIIFGSEKDHLGQLIKRFKNYGIHPPPLITFPRGRRTVDRYLSKIDPGYLPKRVVPLDDQKIIETFSS